MLTIQERIDAAIMECWRAEQASIQRTLQDCAKEIERLAKQHEADFAREYGLMKRLDVLEAEKAALEAKVEAQAAELERLERLLMSANVPEFCQCSLCRDICAEHEQEQGEDALSTRTSEEKETL